MMDGRFDQQFAELFAESAAEEGKKGEVPAPWPLAVACICGLCVFAAAVVLA